MHGLEPLNLTSQLHEVTSLVYVTTTSVHLTTSIHTQATSLHEDQKDRRLSIIQKLRPHLARRRRTSKISVKNVKSPKTSKGINK